MNDDKNKSSNLTPDAGSDSASLPEPTVVAAPEREADQALPPESDTASKPTVTFQGNSYDLAAVVGVTIGGMVLLMCATCNMGYYCLPVVPIALGVIGLATAKDSINPDRTRLLSWLGVGSGVAILLLIFLFVAIYIGLIIFAITLDSGGF
jgi:hypothetical protein